MKHCVITVDGEECNRFVEEPTNREIPITCTEGVLNGSVIRVSKNITNNQSGDYTINMCEFQVFSMLNVFFIYSFLMFLERCLEI